VGAVACWGEGGRSSFARLGRPCSVSSFCDGPHDAGHDLLARGVRREEDGISENHFERHALQLALTRRQHRLRADDGGRHDGSPGLLDEQRHARLPPLEVAIVAAGPLRKDNQHQSLLQRFQPELNGLAVHLVAVYGEAA
jgi:hypothetical protein